MERKIKALLYQKPINDFREKFPQILTRAKIDQSGKPLSELVDLTSLPREHLLMDNLLPLLETPPAQRIAILEALTRIHQLDVDKDYEAVTRHAMPIFDWIDDKKNILREVIAIPFSNNPYMYRQLWAFTFTLKSNDSHRAGVEAYTLSFPLNATMVQFTDGYDPIRYQFFEPIGKIFESLVDFVAKQLDSSIIVNQKYAIPPGSGYESPKGRKPNSDDDWAYQQIMVGRDQNEVYREWLKRIGPRKKNLADPQDSFKKAMRSRKKHGEKRD